MRKIFIVGAGYVGSRAAQFLAERGHAVATGRRTTAGVPGAFTMDALRPDTFPDALREADCVIYTVAADGFSEDAYRAAYVTGLANTVDALRGARARRLLTVGSTGVYGQDDGSSVDEDSPAEPRGFSGRLLLEGEAVAASAPIESTTIRFSGIYGPGRERLVRMVRSGAPVGESARAALTNRIHRDDCARALVHLVERPSVAPLYLGTDEAPTAMGEILDWIANRLGLPPLPTGGVDPGSPQRGGNKRLSSARLRAEGFVFRYPTYREGFGALIDAGA
ncbi:MAG: NAD(P)H-binding protein [Betaproteobacteria bacterium]|nr:NAD(P)H-binding protein [Betaproteobacteria bacterium]